MFAGADPVSLRRSRPDFRLSRRREPHGPTETNTGAGFRPLPERTGLPILGLRDGRRFGAERRISNRETTIAEGWSGPWRFDAAETRRSAIPPPPPDEKKGWSEKIFRGRLARPSDARTSRHRPAAGTVIEKPRLLPEVRQPTVANRRNFQARLSAARRLYATFERGFHSPRSRASSRRSAISRNAAGFESSRNPRTFSSPR